MLFFAICAEYQPSRASLIIKFDHHFQFVGQRGREFEGKERLDRATLFTVIRPRVGAIGLIKVPIPCRLARLWLANDPSGQVRLGDQWFQEVLPAWQSRGWR